MGPTNAKKLSAPGKVSVADFHESWPKGGSSKTRERREGLDRSKRKSPRIKSKSNQKNKEKEGEDEINSGIISFLEDVATKNNNDSTTAPPRKDRYGGFFKIKKSNSARSVKRSSATA